MTTTPATQALLPVTPEDRNEAARMMREMPFGGMVGSGAVEEGENDGHRFVQAFARHRQAHSLPGDVESLARALFVYQHQGDIDDPGQVWDAPGKGLHPIYWQQKMEHNHPHYRAMARAALAALTPSALSGDAGEGA